MNNLKIERAQWWSLAEQPFYGSLALHLSHSIDNSVPTACTDGESIRWNEKFLDQLTPEETRFVLLHEVLHCAHGHLWRFPKSSTDAERRNQACDHAINLTLSRVSGIKMPSGGLCDSQYENLAEEEIYARLKREPQSNSDSKPDSQSGSGNGGQSAPKPDPCGDYEEPAQPDGAPANAPASGPSPQTLREEWEENVIQAAQSAHALGRGSIPGALDRLVKSRIAHRIDWRAEMSEFIRDAVGSRADWSRSARRMATEPVIYPRRRRDDLGLVVFVRDTSGSIDSEVLAEFNGLVQSALAECGCRGVLLDCDAEISAEHWIGAGDEIPPCTGGGGTHFAAPFARASALIDEGERVAGLVYLTDLDGSGWPQSVEFPTLCICTTDQVAGTGRTVRV